MWVSERIQGNEEAFIEDFRMSKHVYSLLVAELVQVGGLHPTRTVNAEEQVAIFLYFAGHHSTSAELQSRFEHSGETITRHLRLVLDAIVSVAEKYIRLPPDHSPVPRKIHRSEKFAAFRNARMAVDGTHIPVWVPTNEQGPFRGRKGITMNVLGACDFNLQFTYVLTGWEGSANDARVYQDALTKGFRLSPNLYDLMDDSYALTTKCLTPYRATRYHLKEFGQGRLKPQNKEELFNLRHSSLRNVIERAFGVLKKRFPVLCYPVQYDYLFQTKVVVALCVVHNFIRFNGCVDDVFVQEADQSLSSQNSAGDAADEPLEQDSDEAKSWRDEIAESMWHQYLEIRRSRRRRHQTA
ncbi:hypothetical protein LEN26_003585 [Aphanomyces euteiches]|nr:hypothetical protein LEN26_003585 [Aphanomyces euteiches]